MGDPRAEALWRWFMGKERAFTLQQEDGSYLKVERPLTLADLEKHVAGKQTVGIYTVTEEHMVAHGAIDIDSKSPQAKERTILFMRWLRHVGLMPLLEASGNKGYHVWVLWKNKLSAGLTMRLLKECVAQAEDEIGKPDYGVEVFPKQASGMGYGSCIKLPWCIHRKTGRRTTFINEDFNAELPEHGLKAIDELPSVSKEMLDEIVAEFVKSRKEQSQTPTATGAPPNAKGFKCFPKMMAGVPEGGRHMASFRIAGILFRQGQDIDMARVILQQWNERNTPPLENVQLMRNLQDAYTGKYSIGCPDIEAAGFCDKECPVYKKRTKETDDRVETGKKKKKDGGDAPFARIVKVMSNPPYYRIHPNGTTSFEVDHEQLFTLRFFHKAYHQVFNQVPFAGMKQVEWLDYLNMRTPMIEMEQAPADSQDTARYIDLIHEWLSVTPGAESEADVDAGHPVKRETASFFKASIIQEQLKKRHHLNIERADLWRLIKNNGGSLETVRVGKRTFKLWKIPLVLFSGEEVTPENNTENTTENNPSDTETLEF
ncbi:MAG: primase C-terminal domain-containing protein [Dehalococcoidales bacterium]|nr:primase C-terminal domain-containing protein [Dehalococcoidales bacterium]